MEAAIPTHFASIEPAAPDVFLDRLLHPARHFKHPHDVLADVALDVQEKRAILSSWASDACAVESVPALRMLPGRVNRSASMRSWMRCNNWINRTSLPVLMAVTARWWPGLCHSSIGFKRDLIVRAPWTRRRVTPPAGGWHGCVCPDCR